ncbi:MAG: class I SAM-dependent methyltransferase [Oscillospiraceae bacterium]|nr:class I SAM-dependent methyltransferase [Oscillospiraceae bacterium]
MNTIKNILGEIIGGKILDVATGDGSFIDLLTNNLKSYDEVIGIDVDEEAIKSSSAGNTNEKVAYRIMSGDNIDYPDGYFDTVSLSNSLHHLCNIDKTISEMLRVLRPNDTIIINELFSDNQNEKQLTHMYFHQFQADIETMLGITHNKTFSKQEIFNIVERNGIRHYSTAIYENESFNKHVNPNMFAERYRKVLEKITGCSEYDKMKAVYDSLVERLYNVGVEFTSQILIVANKSGCVL